MSVGSRPGEDLAQGTAAAGCLHHAERHQGVSWSPQEGYLQVGCSL
jgi:hypothetical protein